MNATIRRIRHAEEELFSSIDRIAEILSLLLSSYAVCNTYSGTQIVDGMTTSNNCFKLALQTRFASTSVFDSLKTNKLNFFTTLYCFVAKVRTIQQGEGNELKKQVYLFNKNSSFCGQSH